MPIGDLAAKAGLSAKAIRFYKQAGLMPHPARLPVTATTLPLAFIASAQVAGFTLAELTRARDVLIDRRRQAAAINPPTAQNQKSAASSPPYDQRRPPAMHRQPHRRNSGRQNSSRSVTRAASASRDLK
jgi:DNA-binding transcriptional MerR regulator